ncbi:metallophosphoesterase [Kineosporia babensis]|uniref:metallophosphoesterase n=1 Tax=Kineosporia babensis TaxID=499548 RepID=UPI0038B259B6
MKAANGMVTAFVGDVHGQLDPLVKIVSLASTQAERLVFLGDYINRGDQSRQVLDFLIDLKANLPDTHFLRGHHEEALLRAIDENNSAGFIRIGGAATLSAYPRRASSESLSDRMPASHIRFLRDLEEVYQQADLRAAHAPMLNEIKGKPLYGVFGHAVQARGVPLITDKYALIDTGCGSISGYPLTCFIWPSRKWFQVT